MLPILKEKIDGILPKASSNVHGITCNQDAITDGNKALDMKKMENPYFEISNSNKTNWVSKHWNHDDKLKFQDLMLHLIELNRKDKPPIKDEL